MDGYSLHHLLLSTYQAAPHTGLFGIHWPNAAEHPLFYVGIYAAIGLASGLASVLSVTAQYTGRSGRLACSSSELGTDALLLLCDNLYF